MAARLVRTIVPIALALLCSTCDDPTAPFAIPRPPNAVDVTIGFCNTPSWFAIKNEGYDWIPIPVTGTRYQLPVTPRLMVAWGVVASAFQTTASGTVPIEISLVWVTYLTAEDLDALECRLPIGGGTVYAPVAGVDSAHTVLSGLGPVYGLYLPPPLGQRVRFLSVPTGTMDLVAATTRYGTSGPAATDKFIVRHNVAVANGATLPTLDFNSNEAGQAQAVSITATGGLGAPAVYFITNRGSFQYLSPTTYVANTSLVYVPPPSLLASGDGFGVSTRDADRMVTHFFATPSTQALTFGPLLSTPTVTTLDATKTLLLRAALPSQPEYPSLASATFIQGMRQFTVTVTAGYLGGTPATWNLDMPDLSGHMKKELLLSKDSTVTAWSVNGWSTRMPLLFSWLGALDGENVRCATARFGATYAVCPSILP